MVSKQIFDSGVCVDSLPSSAETLTFSKYSLLADNAWLLRVEVTYNEFHRNTNCRISTSGN